MHFHHVIDKINNKKAEPSLQLKKVHPKPLQILNVIINVYHVHYQ